MRFLTLSIVAGILVGIVRNAYYSPDYSQQIQKESESFRIVNEISLILILILIIIHQQNG